MSLITRCPACGTLFKVVPDQLRVSEGWVRCGRCEEIFDASAHLQTVAQEPPTVPVASASAGAAANAASPAGSGAPGQEDPAGSPVSAPAPAAANQAVDMELPPADASTSSDIPAVAGVPPSEDADAAATLPLAAVQADDAPASEPPPAPAELSFMRRRRTSRWQRPLVRAALAVLALLLALGLLLQVAVHERDRLAAIEPATRPWLDELCLLLDCEIRPWRQIEAVSIDSSAFSKVRSDVYRLSLTLKNARPYDVALPAVELTLTDALDRPLVRRVLQPQELAAGTQLLHAASELQATLVLALKPSNGERVAGYRLYAFYP